MATAWSERPQTATSEQKQAHRLLIELLAHQFASPVSWIETQDTLLSKQKSSQRLIEIGPASILTGMMNRTIQSKYAEQDTARSLERKTLSFVQNLDQICYESGKQQAILSEVPKPLPGSVNILSSVNMETVTAVQTKQSGHALEGSSSVRLEAVPEAQTPVDDIIRTIIAQKLKKKLDQIPMTATIKSISEGKSTLQNEIIGDLGVEFTSMPDFAEELALSDVAKSVSSDGKLGIQSSKLIARLFSSKLPPAFGYSVARKYLKSRWGFASLRQQGVLLDSILYEPESRLSSTEEAKAFMDAAVVRYAARKSLVLVDDNTTTPTAGPKAIDGEALNFLLAGQNEYLQDQLHLIEKHLKVDSTLATDPAERIAFERDSLRKELDHITAEHGEAYMEGIVPIFNLHKIRIYDSWWNWARVDIFDFFFSEYGESSKTDQTSIQSRCTKMANRSDERTLALVRQLSYQYSHTAVNIDSKTSSEERLQQFMQAYERKSSDFPAVLQQYIPTKPSTLVDLNGNIVYSEISAYNHEKQSIYYRAYLSPESKILASSISSSTLSQETESLISDSGSQVTDRSEASCNIARMVHIKTMTGKVWHYDQEATRTYSEALQDIRNLKMTLQGKYVLITGAGPQSIGSEIIRGLLEGGAKVLVCTSSFSSSIEYFNRIYKDHGSRGSELRVCPFNQGSLQDVQALVKYIYDPTSKTSLGWDLDFIIPFAAISEAGCDISQIGSKSELAHRVMLTNTLRLLGAVADRKRNLKYSSQPTQVILPLSPNHGLFGGDGLYSESKAALEILFQKRKSEDWAAYITLCGAVIGWTRGTGLMNMNDSVCESLESSEGVKTFSREEMSFCILGLLHPSVGRLSEDESLLADLTGGLSCVLNLKDRIQSIRQQLKDESILRKTIYNETLIDEAVINGHKTTGPVRIEPETEFNLQFPPLPNWDADIQSLAVDLQGMIDLDKVVVITGFSELGPWGSARSRWEIEASGSFTEKGCLEMAWILGMIKYHNGLLRGEHYIGWIDQETDAIVKSCDLLRSYESRILKSAGIRLIEPRLTRGYDPENKTILQEVVIEEDLQPFEASKEVAESFKRKHGSLVQIMSVDGQHRVSLKKGASLMVPRSISSQRLVAGLLPTGFDPKRYGLPQDIIDSVDPVTLYALVCVSEALLSSGISDPYEIYRYIHLSEVANCIGSSSGALKALKAVYRDRFTDSGTQKDILQETFINSTSAWINMLLMSATGPIRTPVGACATSVESLDLGYEAIYSGNARLCLVGGTDDFQEENSYEFENMKATNNAVEDFAKGRTCLEMSRPCTSTRAGFVESQGAGVQVLMSASLALEMGAPIYAIMGTTVTAGDKISRSVPAPGQGLLSAAKELHTGSLPMLLDIRYRKRQLMRTLHDIKEQEQHDIAEVLARFESSSGYKGAEAVRDLHTNARMQEKLTRAYWGTGFWQSDPSISPIRGALATWGLTVDDLTFQSYHGTSTAANDANESDVTCKQMSHLGRTKDHPLLGVWQKSVTGHGKAAAGAWQLNGCLQMFNTGIVPGNHNADNIDHSFRENGAILYSDRTLDIGCQNMKAFSLVSFGFGQKGAQAIGVHPRFLFAALDESTFETYRRRCNQRQQKSEQIFQDRTINNNIFVAKQNPPFTKDDESAVFLDPTMRACLNEDLTSYHFAATKTTGEAFSSRMRDPSEPLMQVDSTLKSSEATTRTFNMSESIDCGIGVDTQDYKSPRFLDENFTTYNFTLGEKTHANKAARGAPKSYAGTWAAKEAVFKSLGLGKQDVHVESSGIEIFRDEAGRPKVKLHTHAKQKAAIGGVLGVEISISYGNSEATAVAMCIFQGVAK